MHFQKYLVVEYKSLCSNTHVSTTFSIRCCTRFAGPTLKLGQPEQCQTVTVSRAASVVSVSRDPKAIATSSTMWSGRISAHK